MDNYNTGVMSRYHRNFGFPPSSKYSVPLVNIDCIDFSNEFPVKEATDVKSAVLCENVNQGYGDFRKL